MLSAGLMDNETATALMVFRETHGGTLSGMTRYTDHLCVSIVLVSGSGINRMERRRGKAFVPNLFLISRLHVRFVCVCLYVCSMSCLVPGWARRDDMPAIGYARSSLSHDRIEQFLLLLYGHTANYQGRGSFISNEQQSLYQDPANPSWRASMGEIQASFCTPSQTLVASMTAMQLLDYERQNATIWIARGAPRRWYAAEPDASDRPVGHGHDDHPDDLHPHDRSALSYDSDDAFVLSSTLFGVENGPTRWGNVSFSIGPQVNNAVEFRVAVDFQMPVGAVVHPPTLQVRIRDPSGTKQLVSASIVPADAFKKGVKNAGSGGATGCVVAAVLSDRELVTIVPPSSASPAAEGLSETQVGGAARGKLECTVRASFQSV